MYDERWGRGEAIYIDGTAQNRAAGVGVVRHLRLRDILARSENGVIIHAGEEGDVQGVVLDKLRVELDAWKGEHPIGQHTHSAFAQALFVQRAAGLSVDDFTGEDAPHA